MWVLCHSCSFILQKWGIRGRKMQFHFYLFCFISNFLLVYFNFRIRFSLLSIIGLAEPIMGWETPTPKAIPKSNPTQQSSFFQPFHAKRAHIWALTWKPLLHPQSPHPLQIHPQSSPFCSGNAELFGFWKRCLISTLLARNGAGTWSNYIINSLEEYKAVKVVVMVCNLIAEL